MVSQALKLAAADNNLGFVMKHRYLTGIAISVLGAAVYGLCKASRGSIRDAEAVQTLYDRVAFAYDPAAWILLPLGARRMRGRAIELLDLHPGQTVVDLGCGTGANLSALADAVGDTGRVIGIDLSSKMLAQARRRANRHHLTQVILEQADIRDFELPEDTAAVLASASFEMIPEHDAVVRTIAQQLTITGGRLAVGGIQRPPSWPAWAVAVGRGATAIFGVTRAYQDIQPWRSVRNHMHQVAYETAGGGALYLIVAGPAPPTVR